MGRRWEVRSAVHSCSGSSANPSHRSVFPTAGVSREARRAFSSNHLYRAVGDGTTVSNCFPSLYKDEDGHR